MTKGTGGFGRHIVTIVLFTSAFLLWVGYIAYNSDVLPKLGDSYEVKAVVPSSALLTPGARVTIAGAQVGKLGKIERADAVGPNAKLTLELTDDSVYPLPDDSRVTIRTRSQVGENFVSITVGDSKVKLPDGGQLGLEDADELVNVDQILSILQGPTRDRTRQLFQELGGALEGHGKDLNHSISGLNRFAEHGGELVDALHSRRDQTAQIVDHLGRLMSAVGERGQAIDTIANRGLVAFRAIGERDAALRALLREAPSTIPAVAAAANRLGDFTKRSKPTVDDLARAMRELKPAIADFKTASAAGVQLVRRIDPVRRPLGNALQEVARLARPDRLPQVAKNLENAVCQLNPMLRHLNPYAKDVLQVVYGLGSASNSYDATGHLMRLLPLVNEGSLSGAPPEVASAMKLLLQSGLLTKQKTTDYDPYMKPGVIGTNVANDNGKPSTADEVTASGYKYPRVEADC